MMSALSKWSGRRLADQRANILAVFPHTQTLISIFCRMNRAVIRSPARSVANLKFYTTGDQVDETAHRIVAAWERTGVRALNPAMGAKLLACLASRHSG